MNDAEAELRALCEQYPQFSPEERLQDQQWLAARIDSGKLDGVPVATLKGRIVAVYEKEVALIGDDETEMRVELSKKYQVHPGRFALLLLDEHSAPKKAMAISYALVMVAIALVLCAIVEIVASMSPTTKSTFTKIGSAVGVPTSR